MVRFHSPAPEPFPLNRINYFVDFKTFKTSSLLKRSAKKPSFSVTFAAGNNALVMCGTFGNFQTGEAQSQCAIHCNVVRILIESRRTKVVSEPLRLSGRGYKEKLLELNQPPDQLPITLTPV